MAEEPWLLHVLTVLGQLDDCVSSGVYSQSQRGSEQSRLAIPRRQDVWSALGLCGVTVVLPVPPSAMSGPLLCSRCLWPSEQMTRKLRLGGACMSEGFGLCVWLFKSAGLAGLLFLCFPSSLSAVEQGQMVGITVSQWLLVVLTVKAHTCRMAPAYFISCHIPALLPSGKK